MFTNLIFVLKTASLVSVDLKKSGSSSVNSSVKNRLCIVDYSNDLQTFLECGYNFSQILILLLSLDLNLYLPNNFKAFFVCAFLL